MSKPFNQQNKIVVGATGSFTLASPYSTLTSVFDIYTCKSVRTMDEFISNGEDPWEMFYKEYEGSVPNWRSIYLYQLEENTPIVGLESDAGKWVYVPLPYINASPKVDGYVYQSFALNVSLPAISTNTENDKIILEDIKDEIAAIIQSKIGVEVTVNMIATSRPLLIDSEAHNGIIVSRNTLPNANLSKDYRIVVLENEVHKLTQELSVLKDYIVANQ